MSRRTEVLSWDDYFMSLAFLSSQRSKDPATQVGAVIVNENQRIIGIGYNGFPHGCADDDLPWCKTGDWSDTKYPYVCHAEMNAILNKNTADCAGATIYTTLYPCNECAKLIIQSRIKRVVYAHRKTNGNPVFTTAERLLHMAKVETVEFESKNQTVKIDLTQKSVTLDRHSDDHSNGKDDKDVKNCSYTLENMRFQD